MLEQILRETNLLNEKEAKVYLASLELGQAIVNAIAKKAGVNRATSYFVIENLIKMGLMSSFHKDKKQYFIAADPERLLEIVDQKKKLYESKADRLNKIMPELRSINNKQKNRPVVRYYEGKEGVMAMLDEFMKLSKGTIVMAYSVDSKNKVFSIEEQQKARGKRLNKNIKTRVIYTYVNGILESTHDGERRKVPLKKFPIKFDFAIYDDKVRIMSLAKRLSGIVIEDREIAESFKAILDLAWEAAEKYDKNKTE